MTVNAQSDTAKKIRNLTVDEDVLEPDYLLYTDLLPGHMERERKVRTRTRSGAPLVCLKTTPLALVHSSARARAAPSRP